MFYKCVLKALYYLNNCQIWTLSVNLETLFELLMNPRYYTPQNKNTGSKRPLSMESTPSPTVIKSRKSLKFYTTPVNTMAESIITSQSENTILDISEEHLLSLADNEKWGFVVSALREYTNKIDNLTKENIELKEKVSSVMGNALRLENELEKVNKRITELEWHEMRQNLVFYNIQESSNAKPD